VFRSQNLRQVKPQSRFIDDLVQSCSGGKQAMEKAQKSTRSASDQFVQAESPRWKLSRRGALRLGVAVSVAGVLGGGIELSEGSSNLARAASSTITVSGTQWGVSTAYIGATEGNVRFDTADMTDLGINTYRVYGGMSRWEQQNPYSTYGTPSIDQIKADPNVINWTWWDNAMTSPPNGSDYWWSNGPVLWQGNARTIFANLQSAGIKPVLTVRNRDNNGNPAWAPNPPTTTNDWNVWWGHVFSTVYWLNVRNNYNVNDFEIHNEPNNSGQGWGGTEAQYFTFAQYTHDAIAYVYNTYLPGRTYHVYAPVTSGGSSWPNDALQQIPTYFDSVDVHDYSSNISGYVQQVHGWMNSTGHSSYPLWLSEWGTYKGQYNSISFDLSLINNLISGSQPGTNYVTGSHVFSMYDWSGPSGHLQSFQGLVASDGTRTSGYYAMRLGIRGLQGARPTYQSTASNANLTAITTKGSSGHVYLLVTNGSRNPISADADLSALISSGSGTMWQFDSSHLDVVVGNPVLNSGHVVFTVPGTGAVLLQF
jgi:hypothetical protein